MSTTKSNDDVEPFDLEEKVQVQASRVPNKLLWIVTIAIVIAVVVALAIGLGVGLGVGLRSSEEERCRTAECVQLAAVVMSGIDASVDPCQDFYNFSCGNWINTVPDITEYSFFSVSDLAQERSQRALVNALTVEDSSDIEAVRKAKDLYQSCIDRDSISSYGAAPLLDVINQTGGWPLIGLPGDGTLWDINGTQFMMEKLLRSPAFFTLSVEIDPTDTSSFTLALMQSGLSMEARKYDVATVGTDYIDELRTYIVAVLDRLNPTSDGNTTYIDVANEIIEVETALADIFVAYEDSFEYYFFTLEELASMSHAYNWVGGVADLFATVDITVDATDYVNVITPDYFFELLDVLDMFTPIMLQNYAKWQLTQGFLGVLNDTFAEPYFQFRRKLKRSSQSLSDRAGMCLLILQEVMPLAALRLLAEDILSESAMGVASTMTDEVMAAFRERIGTRDWLDEETSQRCQRKVDLMTQSIAYPEMLRDDDYVNGVYAQITSNNLFQNFLGYIRQSVREELTQLPTAVNYFTIFPRQIQDFLEANAFYDLCLNRMVIYPGILVTPLFDPSWPKYYTYGSTGASTIGHELTHGFDNDGRLHNETGHMVQWWTDASIANFVERQQCYVDQYSQYSRFGIYANGNQTLAENIADNGGLIAGYLAYKNAVRSRGEEPLLDSVPYTRNQLYFIGYAQSWCLFETSESYVESVLTGVHSPNVFRVLGPVSNSPEFAEAFQCAPGTPMNPRDKCALW